MYFDDLNDESFGIPEKRKSSIVEDGRKEINPGGRRKRETDFSSTARANPSMPASVFDMPNVLSRS